MHRPWLSVIIPTIARPSLADLLTSIPDDDPGIETVLVGDIYNNDFTKEIDSFRDSHTRGNQKWWYVDSNEHAWGHPQRNLGMMMAAGEWLAFSQDDNVFAPDSFQIIKAAIDVQPHPRPLLFKIMTWQAGIVWKAPELMEGNIDADCIVVPNIKTKLGKWVSRYNGDWDFISKTVELWNFDVAWRDELIGTALPGIQRHPA